MIARLNMSNRVFIGVLLFVGLCAVYMLTYRGINMLRDELYLYDSIESFAVRGDFYRTYQFDETVTGGIGLQINDDGSPWLPTAHEPLTIVLMSPLFALGRMSSSVGTMHVVWLFNIIITALTAVSIYAIALRLNYSVWISFIAGVIFGIATNAWSYSNLILREPLLGLLVLWLFASALFLRIAWYRGRIGQFWLMMIVIMFVASFLTKSVTILLLPAVFITLIPPRNILMDNRQQFIRLSGVVALGGIAIVGIMAFGFFGNRFSFDTWLVFTRRLDIQYALESFLGYQFSFSRSIWIYSPPLILALWGGVKLFKAGQWRVVLALFAGIFLFGIWYGIGYVYDWWGGWGWGPRYLIPFLPVLTLLILPVLRDVSKMWQKALILIVCLLGIGIQVLGFSVPQSNYHTDLLANGDIYNTFEYSVPEITEQGWHWIQAHWGWELSPINYHLTRADFSHPDIAWTFSEKSALPLLLYIAVLGCCAVLIGWLWKRPQQIVRFGIILSGALIVFLGVSIGVGLYAMRDDPRYIGEWDDVRQLINTIDPQIGDNDAVLIDRHLYTPLFMNYFKSDALVITLPYAPGESYSESGPYVISDDPIQQIGAGSVYAIDWVADQYDRIWLVTDSSPFDATKIRPIEWYLVEHYFPIASVDVSDRARVIEFFTVNAGSDDLGVVITDEYQFDDQLTLTEVHLPLGTNVMNSDVIPISLLWRVQQTLNVDYNVSIYILNGRGELVAQQDGLPQSTFGYTSRWDTESSYSDNHGLQLAPNLPAGDYQLFVTVYNWQTLERLMVYDGAVAIGDTLLLGTIVIEN